MTLQLEAPELEWSGAGRRRREAVMNFTRRSLCGLRKHSGEKDVRKDNFNYIYWSRHIRVARAFCRGAGTALPMAT